MRQLQVTRAQILAFRRRVGHLDERLVPGRASLRAAAWAGLQDSMPRAALLSMHARVEAVGPNTWEDPSLMQVWGPRFSVYLVAECDRAVFTLGRLADLSRSRRIAEQTADQLEAFLDGRRMTFSEAGHSLGIQPNALRYAGPTGRVAMRWDGARPPTVWMVPPPSVDPVDARLELARRHLHVFGPATPEGFAAWAGTGISPGRGRATYEALSESLTPIRTPLGDAWILTEDEDALRTSVAAAAARARLLPSGDSYFLFQGVERELLVPDAGQRADLWPTRVWPGAVLVDGEIAGTWRRAGADVTIHPWRQLSPTDRGAIELEAEVFPVPELRGRIRLKWEA